RLNSDGSLDTSFVCSAGSDSETVRSVLAQSDGMVLIGGPFTAGNGGSPFGMAPLNAHGSLGSPFLPMLGSIFGLPSMAVQNDGKILISGWFSTVNGVARTNLARLYANGSLDDSFLNGLAGPEQPAQSFALQPDGRIVIGGDFYSVNGAVENHIARLYA